MPDELKKIRAEAMKDLEDIRDVAALELARAQRLGRSSELSKFLRGLKDRTADDRKKLGQMANDARAELERLYDEARGRLADAAESVAARLDVTAPGLRLRRGHLHPLTRAQGDIDDIFASMGFRILDGPEVETEFNNFDALNTPPDHPARNMQDTFWLQGMKYLMRAHTSPMQIRFMQAHQPPFRIIVPGRVYRNEATDMTHEFQFHQIEGLMVDRAESPQAPNLANLKGVVEYFFRRYFDDASLDVRFTASYFPFVEPGVEVHIRGTKGKLAGRWLEVAGAGMVHQNVFENVGYVRGEMQGFAFGAALERLVMLKYGISDIRLFQGGDLRFIGQF
ncbi:MAG TPA: phenylalanine--tRNA ligase subunit alpha [Candidatus Paceibacterota bacterium]|nr:phenylalanine--tRNA ligase subunit alpha [Candidatus Paceibacterota bacterium]